MYSFSAAHEEERSKVLDKKETLSFYQAYRAYTSNFRDASHHLCLLGTDYCGVSLPLSRRLERKIKRTRDKDIPLLRVVLVKANVLFTFT